MQFANLKQVGPRTFVDPSKVTVIDYDSDGDIFLFGHFGDQSTDDYNNTLYLPEWTGTAEDLYDVLMGSYTNIGARQFWRDEDAPNPDADSHSAFDEE